jgi:hypothetical protein
MAKRSSICPRRVLEPGPWSIAPEPIDEWRDHSSMVYEGEWTSPSCSHCGSLHPDVLMEGLRAGALSIEGSDKSYKWYVGKLLTEAEIAEAKDRHLERFAGARWTDEEREKLWADMAVHYRSSTVAKFYTPHLSRAQCQEILASWEAKTLNHSMYVRPWFPALAEDAPDWLVAGATT